MFNFVEVMLYMEVLADKIQDLGVPKNQVDQLLFEAFQDMQKEIVSHESGDSEELQNDTTSDCENVYYI